MPVDRRMVGPGLSLAVVTGSYVAVRVGVAASVDRPTSDLLAQGHGRRIDPVVAGLTDLGSIYGMAGIATTLVLTGRRTAGRDVATAGVIAWVAAQGIKPLLHRARPYETGVARRRVAPPAGSSWPSGHAAVAASTAAVLAPRLTPAGRLATAVGAALIGVSRLHVGVHHATDVAAGFGVGSLSAAAWRLLHRRWIARASRATHAVGVTPRVAR